MISISECILFCAISSLWIGVIAFIIGGRISYKAGYTFYERVKKPIQELQNKYNNKGENND